MKFDVLNRWTGAVQFTAEIECADDAVTSVKLGLAVLWGVKNRASLNRANLDGASLDGASLDGASLDGASLDGASLNRASLYGASLNRANLDGANLNRASLDGASLYGASLNRASLDGANLYGANLDGANLDGASLNRASLYGASLNRANLNMANGVNDYVKCIQIDTYPITYTADVLQIGCQRHGLTKWANFSDAEIRAMDGVKALAWWKKYSAWIFATIEFCPAKPTQEVKTDEAAA